MNMILCSFSILLAISSDAILLSSISAFFSSAAALLSSASLLCRHPIEDLLGFHLGESPSSQNNAFSSAINNEGQTLDFHPENRDLILP
jgi:hypothetical protein